MLNPAGCVTATRTLKKAHNKGAALLFEGEATFRQDPTLYQIWAWVGCQPQIPTTGQKKSLKVFGTIELYAARFLYHFQQVFNAQTYLDYLERVLRSYFLRKIHLIQDNTSYHKDKEVWDWFSQHRRHIEVHHLPAYSPQFNALERVWHYTRLQATHSRYFVTLAELHSALTSPFRSIQKAPSQISRLSAPISVIHVSLLVVRLNQT